MPTKQDRIYLDELVTRVDADPKLRTELKRRFTRSASGGAEAHTRNKYAKAYGSLIGFVIALERYLGSFDLADKFELNESTFVSVEIVKRFGEDRNGVPRALGHWAAVCFAWMSCREGKQPGYEQLEDARAFHRLVFGSGSTSENTNFRIFKAPHNFADRREAQKAYFEIRPDKAASKMRSAESRDQERRRLDAKTFGTSLKLERFSLNVAKQAKYALQFDQRVTEFVGRSAAWDELIDFMNYRGREPDYRFRWWQISGDAGQGKSRLALKLVDAFHDRESVHGLRWEAGFVRPLHSEFIAEFRAAKFQRPLLLIVDSVVAPERTELLTKLFEEIFLKLGADEDAQPIRVVVVDRSPFASIEQQAADVRATSKIAARPAEANWYETLRLSRGAEVEQSCWKSVSCHLSSPDFAELLEIGQSWLRRARAHEGLSDEQQVRFAGLLGFSAQARNVDERSWRDARRPLFAILAAEAAISEVTQPESNFEGLLEHALAQERSDLFSRTELRQVSQRSRRIALLANVIGKVATEDLPQELIDDGFYPSSTAELEIATRLNGSSVLVRPYRQFTKVPGRQPDILAEYQFLRDLEQCEAKDVPGILNVAWEISELSTFEFLSRLVDDFIDDSKAPELVFFSPNSLAAFSTWVSLASNSLPKFASAGRRDVVWSVLSYWMENRENWLIRVNLIIHAHFLQNLVWSLIEIGENEAATDLCAYYIELIEKSSEIFHTTIMTCLLRNLIDLTSMSLTPDLSRRVAHLLAHGRTTVTADPEDDLGELMMQALHNVMLQKIRQNAWPEADGAFSAVFLLFSGRPCDATARAMAASYAAVLNTPSPVAPTYVEYFRSFMKRCWNGEYKTVFRNAILKAYPVMAVVLAAKDPDAVVELQEILDECVRSGERSS